MNKIILYAVLLGILIHIPLEAKDSITWEDVKTTLGSKEAQGVYIVLGAVAVLVGLRFLWVRRQRIKNFIKTIGKASKAQMDARRLDTILSSNKNEQEKLNDIVDLLQDEKDGAQCYVEQGNICVKIKEESEVKPDLDYLYRIFVAYKGIYNKNNNIKRIYINDVLEMVGIVWP